MATLQHDRAEVNNAGAAAWYERFSIDTSFKRSSSIPVRCRRDTYDWYTPKYP